MNEKPFYKIGIKHKTIQAYNAAAKALHPDYRTITEAGIIENPRGKKHWVYAGENQVEGMQNDSLEKSQVIYFVENCTETLVYCKKLVDGVPGLAKKLGLKKTDWRVEMRDDSVFIVLTTPLGKAEFFLEGIPGGRLLVDNSLVGELTLNEYDKQIKKFKDITHAFFKVREDTTEWLENDFEVIRGERDE